MVQWTLVTEGAFDCDVAIVGAGAAGLATAVFAARAGAGRVVCLEGARRLGAKILVSGGGRCNVTNREVTERDFRGGSTRVIRAVLRAFPAPRAAAFFEELGVPLHEEEYGKLFPDSNRARDVVDALLRAADDAGVMVRAGYRVSGVLRRGPGFEVAGVEREPLSARTVVLATGGRSLPKSGSDGLGYLVAASLGHSCIPTTPALVPLVLDDEACARLSGVACDAELRVHVNGRQVAADRGSLLWTHFGISGPAALDVSRHWLRARIGGSADVGLSLNLCPGETSESVEQWLLARGADRPRAVLATILGERLPRALADAWVQRAGLDPLLTLSHLDREARRRLVRALVDTPLSVRDSRGYSYAEVTAGGVPLDEIDPASMASRVCPDLHLVGEILDVDGRLGGFNFQWAWSSAFVAGGALGRRARRADVAAGR